MTTTELRGASVVLAASCGVIWVSVILLLFLLWICLFYPLIYYVQLRGKYF